VAVAVDVETSGIVVGDDVDVVEDTGVGVARYGGALSRPIRTSSPLLSTTPYAPPSNWL
jgi:hypothetical protein